MSRSFARIRLMKELEEMSSDPPAGCSASPVDEDNILIWDATITGPDDSPWEGGIYVMRLRFNDNYPDQPPYIRFTTPMYHPNIFSDGSICLDIIRDKWQPIYTVNSILTSIMSLLTDPNPASPANPEAANLYIIIILNLYYNFLYLHNPKEYRRRVRQCAEQSIELACKTSYE
ncbi:hypothetical protein WA158_001718 [Blastocystis sp. Blastoise]